MYNTNILNDDFWGDFGIDNNNDFNDDLLLSETSDVGPDYEFIESEFIFEE